MTHSFNDFLNKKNRESGQHLKTVEKMLEKHGFTVENFLDGEEPYIFLNSNNEQLSFGGVRIYNLGNLLAFRVQKESDTHPYGKAYLLDIEGIFNDLMSEGGDEQKAGEKLIKTIIDEFKQFFKKSRDAEKDLKSADIEQEKESDHGGGKVVVRSTPLDYGLMIGGKV